MMGRTGALFFLAMPSHSETDHQVELASEKYFEQTLPKNVAQLPTLCACLLLLLPLNGGQQQ